MNQINTSSLGAYPSPTRRDFLRVGAFGSLGVLAAPRSGTMATGPKPTHSVIFLMLVGGPSQLETWDPKPNAPISVRGPFAAIPTGIPGVFIGELLPRLSRCVDRLTIIRSLFHNAAPIHETGFQILQTGDICTYGQIPHLGSLAAEFYGAEAGLPPFMVLPGPIGATGTCLRDGQTAGSLGIPYEPYILGSDPASSGYDARGAFERARRHLDLSGLGTKTALAMQGIPGNARVAFDLGREPSRLRESYGCTTFGQSCLLARRLVEAGVRFVTVNMFSTVFNQPTWDCHGMAPFSRWDDIAGKVLPAFDLAFSALIRDLDTRGMLDTTLVVAVGEFGRTPRLNSHGGRDHWTRVWSAALAGGGLGRGEVVGASDRLAMEPYDSPFAASDLPATIARCLNIY